MPQADIRFDTDRIVILQRDWLAKVDRGGFYLCTFDKRTSLPSAEHFSSFDHAKWRFDDLTVGMQAVA